MKTFWVSMAPPEGEARVVLLDASDELAECERELYPELCVAPWAANAVRNTWGPCVGDVVKNSGSEGPEQGE